MKGRHWILVGVFVALALTYVICFTEWLRPAPIEVASQVRFAIQPPRFGRSVKRVPFPPGATGAVQVFDMNGPGAKFPDGVQIQRRTLGATGGPPGAVQFVKDGPKLQQAKAAQLKDQNPPHSEQLDRIGVPDKGKLEQAPGGVANVTFSLDNWYQLTRVRVEDVPADGSKPKIMWRLTGKSLPLNSLLYNRIPEGMKPLLAGEEAEPLLPGVPYRLIVEAGRRRGTNAFSTVALSSDHP